MKTISKIQYDQHMPIASDKLKLFQSIRKDWSWNCVTFIPKTDAQKKLIQELWP